MPQIAIRISDEEKDLIAAYAKQQRRSVADVVRLAILDKIEDEYDLELYQQAKAEFDADPTTYTLDEVVEELKSNG